jgi:hypothetical protein
MCNVLLFQCHNSCANALECYVYTCINCLAFFCQGSRLIIIFEVSPRNVRNTPSARRTESIKKKPPHTTYGFFTVWGPPPPPPPPERGVCAGSALSVPLQYALTAAKLAKLFRVTPQIMKESSSLERSKICC